MGALPYLTDDPIDMDALVRSAMRPSDGAQVVFAGAVRNLHEGHAVASIYYDAYRPMAEKELAAIAGALRSDYPEVAVAMQHRLGHLAVGEVSIGIVATAPHRAEAFAACREAIERIKKSVPIWKKEIGPEGEEWVGWR